MQLYCAKCQAAFTAKRDCPKCGSRLIAPTEAHVLPADRAHFVPPTVGTSSAGRVTAGAAVAVGLFMGFREILAGLLSFVGESESWWASGAAFGVLAVVKAIAAGGGGVLAGAGRPNATVTGLLAGAVAGGAIVALEVFSPGGKFSIGLALGAALMAAVATAAGAIAGKVWPPRSELPKAQFMTKGSSILEKAKDLQNEDEAKKVRPTQWVRVMLGVSLTVCGFVAAEGLRHALVRGGDGIIDLGGTRNVPFSCLQIAGIVALLGGVAAGASTGAGFRHGVFAGLIAGAIAAGLFGLRGPQKLPAAAGVLEVLEWSPDKTPVARAATAVFGAEFLIGSVGGLFGGLLFPPLVVRPKIGKPDDIGRSPANLS